jgi:hypothetical protein
MPDWELRLPGEVWLRATRMTDDGKTEFGFVGYPSKAVPDGKGNVHFTFAGPERLLEGRPLPYRPPRIELATNPQAFEFNWNQIDFVFDLPDPRAFPPLPPGVLSSADRKVLERYVELTRDLAQSQVINDADSGLTIRLEDYTDAETVLRSFPTRELQTGFAAMLRHCDSDDDDAGFRNARTVLWQANAEAADEQTGEREETIRAWKSAIGRLHQGSLNQLLRDKLAREHQLRILDFPEQHSPAQLLSLFNYGDLLHWGSKRDMLATAEEDEVTGADRRLAFLNAAANLAHAYIGFGVLLEAALGAAGSAPDVRSLQA